MPDKAIMAGSSVAPLLEALSRKVIPWSRDPERSRIVSVPPAQRSLKQLQLAMPPGIAVSRRKRRGRRVAVKGSHHYGYAIATARWSEDGLQASRMPYIVCVLDGQADIKVDDSVFHCSTGRFLFIPAGVAHPDGSAPHLHESCSESSFCDLLWLYPWGGGIVCCLCHSRGKKHWLLEPGEHCLVLSRQAVLFMNELTQELTGTAEKYEDIGDGLFTLFLRVLQRELERGHFAQQGVELAEMPAAKSGDTATPMDQAQQYILSNLHKPLTISQVAGAVYVSRSRFTTEFRRATGKSFVAFLTEQRLRQAKSMLRETELEISAVGQFVGLKPRHLDRLFRRYEGLSPSEFRSKGY